MKKEEFLEIVCKGNNSRRELYNKLISIIPDNKTFRELASIMNVSYPSILKYLEPFKLFGIINANKYKRSGYNYNNEFFKQ